MSDKKLQSEFDEYFGGAELPGNLTADAKAAIKPKKRVSFKWLKFAPAAVAAAVIISVSAVWANFALSPDKNASSPDTGQPAASYSSDSLTKSRPGAYGAKDLNEGLGFAAKFASVKNASVDITCYSREDVLYYAQAQVSLLTDGYRCDADIYAEFTDENTRLEGLESFLSGETKVIANRECIFAADSADGENLYKIYFKQNAVKYYLTVTTSGGEKCLYEFFKFF